jgi:hypothetical protein
MMLQIPFRIAIVVAVASYACPTRGQAAAPAEEVAARQAINARMASLRAVTLDYSAETSETPAGAAPRDLGIPLGVGPGQFSTRWGIERTDGHVAFLDERFRWDERKTAETLAAEVRKGGVNPIKAIVRSHRPGATEQLIVRSDGTSGRVSPASSPRENAWAAIALGLREAVLKPIDGRVTPEMLGRLAFARDKEGHVVLSGPHPEGAFPREFVFDPANGHALVAYRIWDKERKKVCIEVTAADFRPVNGLSVPFAMSARWFNISYERPILKWSATVTRGEVGGTANNEDHYRIAWPEGIDVVDERTSPPQRVRIQADGEKTPD